MKQKILMTLLVGLMLVSVVTANPISDFWKERGLNSESADRIGSGNENVEDVRLAEALQNPIDLETNGINQTAQALQEEKDKNDLWFLFYAGIFTTLLFGVIIALGVMFFGWGSGL